MNRRMVAAAMACVVIGSGLTGCGSSSDAGPAPTAGISNAVVPTPTPVPTRHPSVSSTPSPSSDALFVEATEVHRKYLDQVLKLEKSGGADELPDDLQELVTGQYKRDLEGSYRRLKTLGTRADDDSVFRVLWVRESPIRGTGVVAIRACVDASDVVLQDKNGNAVGRGSTRQDDLEFTRSGNRLVISDGDSRRVEKCSK